MADIETTIAMPTATFLSGDGRQYVRGKVLDVGCGPKPYKKLYPELEWVGLDIRPVAEIVCDAHKIEADDESFDTVLCTDVLNQCGVPQMVVNECVRVLKPGGALIITTPNCFPDDEHSSWGIKPRGLDYLISFSGMEGILLQTNGRLFTQEWKDYIQFMKYGNPVPLTIDGWTSQMDERYPVVTLAVAKKPERAEEEAESNPH